MFSWGFVWNIFDKLKTNSDLKMLICAVVTHEGWCWVEGVILQWATECVGTPYRTSVWDSGGVQTMVGCHQGTLKLYTVLCVLFPQVEFELVKLSRWREVKPNSWFKKF